MSSAIKVTGGDKWKKALEPYLQNCNVNVGILAGSTYPETGLTVATVGAAQEFGTKDIPARSFMRSTLAIRKEEWINLVKDFLSIPANRGKIKQAFVLLGEVSSKDIQQTIEDSPPPPLKDATIKDKAKRGKANPAQTLIDTGVLQESISYEVTP